METFSKIFNFCVQHWYIVLSVLILLPALIAILRTITIKNRIRELAKNAIEMTPEEFFLTRNAQLGRSHISTLEDFVGVYVLYNETKNLYYVGQAKKVLQRVNAHFTGHGNGDVYADYKYGDSFKIRTISLVNSGYTSLDRLEKETIASYDAYSKGYNKTRGNGR